MTDFLRRTRLEDASDAVERAARFRVPQARSFDRLKELIASRLADDLPRVDQSEVNEAVRRLGLPVPGDFPELYFALATGVGKRRLMGACAAYLYAARQTKNVLILAPRDAILRKLEQEASDATTPDYLLLDTRVAPVPNVCTRDNLDSFDPEVTRLNLFVLSPQSLIGGDRRIAKVRPFSAVPSLLEYLTDADDLVVLSDEAHHIGDEGAAWRAGIDALRPKLYFGFTATPPDGKAIIYTYNLAECLHDGLYTKRVELYTKKRDDLLDDSQWETVTIDYALGRLRIKEDAAAAFRLAHPSWPEERPVLLLTCRDKEHAEAVGAQLVSKYAFEDDEVIVTHSGRRPSEAELSRLIDLDSPGNRARVVVQVQQLTEGWDVQRVYVMAPLRVMGTFEYAIQNLGRGLRLPAGERVGDEELDTLDVVLFGRETTKEIIEKAKKDFGDTETGTPAIQVTPAGDVPTPPPAREVVSQKPRVEVEWTWPEVTRVPATLDLDFHPEVPGHAVDDIVTRVVLGSDVGAQAADVGGRYEVADLKRVVVPQVCRRLEFLDEITDRPALELLIDRVLEQLNLGGEGDAELADVYVPPERLAAFLVSDLSSRRRALAPRYEFSGRTKSLEIKLVKTIVPEGASPTDQSQVGA